MTAPVARGTGQLRSDAARITELVASDLSAPVPACPGWSLRDLVEHLGRIHRWAQTAVETGSRPAKDRPRDPAPEAADALARWFGNGAMALAKVFDETEPDTPTWTPFGVDAPTVSVWTRRQTHETSLHRWDAESAVTSPRPIDAELATDGVDEYLGMILSGLVARRGLAWPTGSVHLHCTDAPGEWTVELRDGIYVVDREHCKGDAAVRGRAEDLFLLLWGRSVPDDAIEVIGDESVARGWTSIGGA